MVRNFGSDGSPFSVTKLRTLDNAHASEGIVSGCDATVGTGSWDVDIASGVANVQGARVDVSSTPVTLDSSASEDRIDLITVNSSGTVSDTTGTAASTSGEPNAPDIPAGEVLITLVYVRGGSSGLQSGDILNEYRVIKEEIEDYTTGGSEGDVPVAQSDGSIAMDQGAGSGIDADTLQGGNFTTETGTFTASRSDVRQSVSFNNTYEPGRVIATLGRISEQGGASEYEWSVSICQVTTDGSGDVDGVEFLYRDTLSDDRTFAYRVLGVQA